MRCPFCGHDDTQVKDSRPTEENSAIRRRRHCPECGGRFTTVERVQLRELVVVKKNGRRETFERDKLERSISHALRKRPVERERIERMVTGIVRRLESMGENEIPSTVIGELVMQALSSLDKVAYVRFASVYKNFRETKDFEALIGELEGGDRDYPLFFAVERHRPYATCPRPRGSGSRSCRAQSRRWMRNRCRERPRGRTRLDTTWWSSSRRDRGANECEGAGAGRNGLCDTRAVCAPRTHATLCRCVVACGREAGRRGARGSRSTRQRRRPKAPS